MALTDVDVEFTLSNTGDFEQTKGEANVTKRLLRRLMTVKGTIVHRPTLGVGLKTFVNSINSLETQRKLASEIQEQFEQDPDVEKVVGVKISTDSSNVTMLHIRVKLVGVGEQSLSYNIGDLP